MTGKAPKVFFFFWASKAKKYTFLRVEFKKIIYPSLEQLKRHIFNHFDMNSSCDIVFQGEDGSFTKLENLNQIQNGRHFFLTTPGISISNSLPLFMKDNEKRELVFYMFTHWDELLNSISKTLKVDPAQPSILFNPDGSVSKEFETIAPQWYE